MEGKKKRGCNYTAVEKEILLKLIKKYQNIIESKEINSLMISKKRESWDSVCQQYNAVSVSGLRTWQQLRHLYENIKQRSKKNTAQENNEINTCDGVNKSNLTEQDATVSAMVTLQVQPLSNPYDDATLCFDDIKKETNIKTEVESSEVLILTTATSSTVHQEAAVNNSQEYNQPQMSPVSSTINYQECTQPQTSSALTSRVKSKRKGSDIKQQYFKQKLRNAKLEHKYLINKNRMEQNKYKLEMQILKLKLQKLKSRCKN